MPCLLPSILAIQELLRERGYPTLFAWLFDTSVSMHERNEHVLLLYMVGFLLTPCFWWCWCLSSGIYNFSLVGGVKLGAGGLIRAYGGAARLVLREAPKETFIPKTSVRLLVSSSNAGTVYDATAKVGGVICAEEYTVGGDFIVTITCETQHESRLRECLTDSTRGSVKFLHEDLQDDS